VVIALLISAQSFFQQMLVRFSEMIFRHAPVQEGLRFWADLISMLDVVVDLWAVMEICLQLFGLSLVVVTKK